MPKNILKNVCFSIGNYCNFLRIHIILVPNDTHIFMYTMTPKFFTSFGFEYPKCEEIPHHYEESMTQREGFESRL